MNLAWPRSCSVPWWLRRGLGVVFVVVGLLVMVGLDRDLQTWILVHSPVAPWELDSGFVPRG